MINCRILLVDDDPLVRKTLKNILESRTFKVAQAESAVKAREILKTQNFDILITDHQMPGLSGEELIVLSLRDHPDLLCILISGNRMTSTLKLSDRVCFLEKPFGIEDILEKINSYSFKQTKDR
ncbi:MAG: response regulator [Deltaproteobacteria bacterium]|nr:response regulator [Deltaproteobacteria bacterium]